MVIGATFAMTTLRYFQAKSGEPTDVTHATLSRGQTLVPTYFAQIEGDALYDTGISFDYYVLGIPIAHSYYGLLKLNDRLLLVYSTDKPDETARVLTGSIYAIDAETRRDIIDRMIEAVPELGDIFLPYVLDIADVRHAQWYFGAAALLVAAVAGIIMLVPALQRLIDPGQDPTWRRLATYGKATDVIVTEIERDTQNGWQAGIVTLGDTWITSPGRDFTAINLDDIVWIYRHTDAHNINGVATALRHKAIVWDGHGTKLTGVADENTVNTLLKRLHARAPWAVAGHSAEIENTWKTDRALFLRSVAERKQSILQDQP